MPKITLARVAALFGVLAILYAVLLFFTLKTDEKDVSNLAPYSDYIGKQFYLEEEVIIFKNQKELRRAAEYLMLDMTDPPFDGEEELYTLPVGHEISFTKAMHYRGGVSGFTASMIVGETIIPQTGEKVNFEYLWGSEVVDLDAEKPLRFTYNKAPWQKEALKGEFAF